MNKKLNKISILALVLSVLFCLTAFILPTVSRYITITKAPFDGSDELDYTVNAVFEVKNQDDLFAAINQGYSYVQLSKDIENPLIVTEKAENLDADLILDLNGIEIQRNGYEPILNVNKGVRLTVVDTSTEQTGGLYNPVGSVFNIKGGTLTVVTGTFESGPRYSEYYSYNEDILSSETDYTKRTLVEPTAQKVNYYTRNSEGDFDTPTIINAPIIRSYPVVTGDIIYNHGNLYFDHTITRGDLTITPDTYCYYRTSEDKSASDDSQVAADWYYSYFVTRDYYEYYGTNIDGVADPEDYIEITIYGYEDVIDGASKIEKPSDYYAAIQMQSGMLEVQSGSFNSYFGVDTTACVNSQGGTITVKSGAFASRIPDALSQAADSVDIKEDDSLAYDATYFYHYDWSTEANGSLAKKGQSYCILNGGNAEVSIGDGKFYSSDNSTIHMKGGNLNIGAGTISKKTTTAPPGVNLTAEQIPYYSAIYMENGELAVSNAEFNVLGDRTLGMTMQNGLLEITNATCNLSGSYVYGIKSSVSGLNNFNVTDVTFNLTGGDNQTGIYAENGRVNVSSTSTDDIKTMTVDGQSSVGILVTNGGSVNSTAYNYVLNGSGSAGIYSAENGAIDMINGEMQVKGDNSYGIYSLVTGQDSFNVKDVSFDMTGGNNQTGIYAENGRVNISSTAATDVKTMTIDGQDSVGIKVLNRGSVYSNLYNYTLNGAYSTGIYSAENGKIDVSEGQMQVKGDNSYGIFSLVEGDDSFNVKNLLITMTDGEAQTGIYAENGRVNITSTDSDKDTITIDGNEAKGISVANGGSVYSDSYNYTLNGDYSYGIHSIGGMVEVKSTTIDLESNVSCYGIYARSDVESISIDLVDGFIDVGYNAGGTKTGTVAASVGVFMATNNNANTVNITRSKIHSYEIGIALEGGSLNVNETATVLTQKASSIVVLGGNLTFAESTTENADGGVGAGFSYVLSSSNTRATKNMTASSRNTLLGYYTNSYNLTLPTAYGGTQNYANRDGVYVSSDAGNSRLDILGKVKIEHAGLANNIYTSGTTKYTRYDQVVINSYAVAVSGGNVNIRKAEITAHVGGGVSCSDGNITLGASDSLTNNDDITVLAKGNITDDANSTSNAQSNQTNYNSIGTWISNSWMNERSVTGGNAVALIGGNITVYGGYFEATFGNGVSATVPTSFTSGQDGGTINVLGGTFIGWHNDDDNDLTNARKSGPAAHYGLKVIGGCNVNIYGGTFDGGNGGALVTGINKFTSRTNISSTNNKYATVRVYAGKFGDSQSATPANLDGFNVYDMSDVVFGAHPANTYASASEYANAIVIYAQNAAIATNPITEAATRIASTVRVYYGSYHPVQTGTEDGNWNANATCTFYNTRTNHTLYFVKTANNFNIVNNQTAQFYVA